MTTTAASPESIEAVIRRLFEENYERLRLEGGHSLSPEAREVAWQQVRLYWLKLHEVAAKVTDTEVKLNLPGQTTPKGRKFGIEGVVDIVHEDSRTTMYDIKTHDLDAIRGNLELYEQQLNVYAHIWRNLRGQALDEVAIISTSFPRAVREALDSGIPRRLEAELAQWEPVVRIPFSEERLEKAIRHFSEIVDAIEDGDFDPAPVTKLQSRSPGMRATFATQVCINCDARYSCDSFRVYNAQSRRIADATMPYLAEGASDIDVTDRIVAGLDAISNVLE
jgi:hypothetical protein